MMSVKVACCLDDLDHQHVVDVSVLQLLLQSPRDHLCLAAEKSSLTHMLLPTVHRLAALTCTIQQLNPRFCDVI